MATTSVNYDHQAYGEEVPTGVSVETFAESLEAQGYTVHIEVWADMDGEGE